MCFFYCQRSGERGICNKSIWQLDSRAKYRLMLVLSFWFFYTDKNEEFYLYVWVSERISSVKKNTQH